MNGEQAINIVREYFPDLSDVGAGVILWEFTGWPSFWMGDPETCLRQQLQDLKDGTTSAAAARSESQP